MILCAPATKMKNCLLIALFIVLAAPAQATTYFLAPASDGGNDSNSGTSSSTPWLSPNHPVNCGDVIIAAASSSYSSANFQSGKWGTVSCPGNNNVAWLECATFDACKITATSGEDGIHISTSYWGVQGWEITATSSQESACFAAVPPTSSVSIHHLVFANNIANGCDGGGFVTYNNGSASSDYIGMVGNIAYNGAQGNAFCYSGITVAAPVNTDTAAGTHIYVSGNFLYHNVDPNPCQGVTSTDGEGLIFDTIDGSSTGHPYTGQMLADNNMFLGNGARGFEVFLNQNSTPAIVYVRQNTSWGNGTGTINNLCGEILTNSANSTQIYDNIAVPNTATACGSLTHYAYLINGGNSTILVTNNYADSTAALSYFSEYTSGFSFGAGNLTANPSFASPSVPGAPNCGSATSVPNCMATVVANFTPTIAAAKPYGYQTPSTSQTSDPLFPQWLCNVNLPAGLVTMGCASSSSLPAPPTDIKAIAN